MSSLARTVCLEEGLALIRDWASVSNLCGGRGRDGCSCAEVCVDGGYF